MTILKLPQQKEEKAIVLEKILMIEKTTFIDGHGQSMFLIEIVLGNNIRTVLGYETAEERDVVYDKLLSCYTEIKEL